MPSFCREGGGGSGRGRDGVNCEKVSWFCWWLFPPTIGRGFFFKKFAVKDTILTRKGILGGKGEGGG